MSHVVTAALVVSKKQDGSDLYLYEGATVPEWVPAEDVARLTGLGMVEKVDGRSAKSPEQPTAESN